MPELPEVETIKRGLEPLIVKKIIRQVEVDATTRKAFQGDEANVVDAEVAAIRRRGKALLVDLSSGYTMMIHLRMTGQLIWRGAEADIADDPTLSASSLSTGALLAHRMPNTARSVTPVSVNKLDTEGSYGSGEEDAAAKVNFAAGHPSKNFMDNLPNSQTRVTFVFDEGTLYFNDQRKFGFVKVIPTSEVEQEKFIAELAKEPWEMDVKELFSQCQRHKNAPIKAVLLDQKVIAGLGNIYADESLFYASVHPAIKAGDLSEKQVGKILEGARNVMMASIDSGGSTMATYVKPDGTTGSYLENFAQVFRREGKKCLRCGEIIQKTRVAGRGTHYCPHCQKLEDSALPRTSSKNTSSRKMKNVSLENLVQVSKNTSSEDLG